MINIFRICWDSPKEDEEDTVPYRGVYQFKRPLFVVRRDGSMHLPQIRMPPYYPFEDPIDEQSLIS